MYDMRDKSGMRKFAQRLIKIIVGVVLFFVLAFIAREIYRYIIIDTDLIMPGSPDYKISYYQGYERYKDIDFKVCHTLTEEEQEKYEPVARKINEAYQIFLKIQKKNELNKC